MNNEVPIALNIPYEIDSVRQTVEHVEKDKTPISSTIKTDHRLLEEPKRSLEETPKASSEPKDPEVAAEEFILKNNGYGLRLSMPENAQPSSAKDLIAATGKFAKLPHKVQDKVLRKITYFLEHECVRELLKAYLSLEGLQDRYDAFKELGITVSVENHDKLVNAFNNSFGSTAVPKKVIVKNPQHDANDFSLNRLSDGPDKWIADREEFAKQPPEVQDKILYNLTCSEPCWFKVLDKYLTSEGLGEKRYNAFFEKYGFFFSSDMRDPNKLKKLQKVLDDGFGGTEKTTQTSSQPASEKPVVQALKMSQDPDEQAAINFLNKSCRWDIRISISSEARARIPGDLRLVKVAFSKLDPKVQDHVLKKLAEEKFYHILQDYIDVKWLDVHRINAFLGEFKPESTASFGRLFTAREAEERRDDLIKIFADGFGSTAKKSDA